MENRLKVAVICMANYCRSPVAENCIKHFAQKNLNLTSLGLTSFFKTSMDQRSSSYLESNGINYGLHIPKKITQDNIDSFDLVLAIDENIVIGINDKFNIDQSKVKAFNLLKPEYLLKDPYQSKEISEYNACMKEIMDLSKRWASFLDNNELNEILKLN